MLRCVRTSFPARWSGSRLHSSKNPSMNPPTLKKGSLPAGEAAVDSGFKGTVVAFMLIQGVGIACFGLAHKMEDDASFAKKMEQYYDIPGVQPTLTTFRSIIQFVMPKLREKGLVKHSAAPVAAPAPAPAPEPVPAVIDVTPEVVEVLPDVSVEQAVVEEVVAVPEAISEPEPVLEEPPAQVEEVVMPDPEEVRAQEADKMAELVSQAAAVSAADEAVQTTPVAEKPIVLPAVEAETRLVAVKGESAEEALNSMNASATRARLELQSSLLQDLDVLNNEELRKRITQLAAEFFERTKWEGLRMHEALKHLEGELSDKYASLMEAQRTQLQAELEKALVAREKTLLSSVSQDLADANRLKEEAVSQAIQAQAAGFHMSVQKQLDAEREVMQKEFEDSYNAQAALLKHAQVQELVRVTDALEQVKADVASFEGIVDTVNANQKAARELHLQTAAILALQELLAGSSPLGDVVPALKKRLSANELVVRTLDTLSARGLSTGIATSAELRLRFKVVRKEVRKASLIPEFAPNFLGQAVGSALASISWRPADGSKVDKTTINSGDIEDQLASVAYYLDLSDLPAAVKECDNIKGYPRLLMADWEAAVKDRMAADLAVSVLKSEMSLKHQQMSKL